MSPCILFSPCHYIFDELKWGSEVSWAYNIADRISSLYPDSIVVTGCNQAGIKKKYRIIELQPSQPTVNLSVINSLIFNIKYSLTTLRLSRKHHFDVIHHVLPFGIGNTFNISLIIRSKTTPIVIGPIQAPLAFKDKDIGVEMTADQKVKNSINFNYIPLLIFGSFLKLISRMTLMKASKIITINHYTKDLLQNMGIPETKIEVIPPGIDTKIFALPVSKSDKSKNFTLISTSKLLLRKKIDVIILAVKEAIENHLPVRLIIVGDGPQKQKLESLVTELGMNNFIEFRGYVCHADINRLYSLANAFVSMSQDESWGQVYLEAMSCGLPVLTTKNNGSREILQDGKCGYFVETDNPHDLFKKISLLVNNLDLSTKLGKYARKYVRLNYDWDEIVIPRYLNLYKSISHVRL